MDLVFTIGGLMLWWSMRSYLQRERQLKRRLNKCAPPHLLSFEVLYPSSSVLAELNHFVKRNHLEGKVLFTPTFRTWILKSSDHPDLRFPVYIKQTGEHRSLVQVGALDLNGRPYFMYRNKHRSAARSLGRHFESYSLRQKYFAAVLQQEREASQVARQ